MEHVQLHGQHAQLRADRHRDGAAQKGGDAQLFERRLDAAAQQQNARHRADGHQKAGAQHLGGAEGERGKDRGGKRGGAVGLAAEAAGGKAHAQHHQRAQHGKRGLGKQRIAGQQRHGQQDLRERIFAHPAQQQRGERGHKAHVQAGHRQQVRGAAAAKGLLLLVGQAVLLAQQQSGGQAALLRPERCDVRPGGATQGCAQRKGCGGAVGVERAGAAVAHAVGEEPVALVPAVRVCGRGQRLQRDAGAHRHARSQHMAAGVRLHQHVAGAERALAGCKRDIGEEQAVAVHAGDGGGQLARKGLRGQGSRRVKAVHGAKQQRGKGQPHQRPPRFAFDCPNAHGVSGPDTARRRTAPARSAPSRPPPARPPPRRRGAAGRCAGRRWTGPAAR